MHGIYWALGNRKDMLCRYLNFGFRQAQPSLVGLTEAGKSWMGKSKRPVEKTLKRTAILEHLHEDWSCSMGTLEAI